MMTQWPRRDVNKTRGRAAPLFNFIGTGSIIVNDQQEIRAIESYGELNCDIRSNSIRDGGITHSVHRRLRIGSVKMTGETGSPATGRVVRVRK